MKKSKSQKDFYYNKAKKDNYLARSVYKLEEINNKYNIINKNKSSNYLVLDLGASPGSWLQYFEKTLNLDKDTLIANDINEIKYQNSKINYLIKSVHELSIEEILSITNKKKLDLIVSDMAPKTSGIKIQDQALSIELATSAFDLAKNLLKNNGNFLCKIFQIISPEIKDFKQKVNKQFKEVHIHKPKSSSPSSYEAFIVGKSYKG